MDLKVIYLLLMSALLILTYSLKHLLMVLLSMEVLVLSSYGFMFVLLGASYKCFSIFFLTMCVCEGAMGLSMLVVISRVMGSDLLGVVSMVD